MSIQSIYDIGETIRNARVFNLKDASGAYTPGDSLFRAVQRLFDLLSEREIDYLLVGGVALLTYVKGRNTQDIDLIMAPEELARMPEIAVTGKDSYFVRGTFEGMQIDLLLTDNPLFRHVKDHHAAVKDFQGREIRCASVEGLILLKLYALPSLYRQGQFALIGLYENDIGTLMQAYQPDMAPLLVELAKHLGKPDMDEVIKIIGEVQGRIERFRKLTQG